MADEFTASQEAALLRTLRDIRDGHIILRVDANRYDPMTGELLPRDEIVSISPDRGPAAGVPDAFGDWWTLMMHRGWLALHWSGGRAYLRVETPGFEALEAGGW